MKLAASPGGPYFHRMKNECDKIKILADCGFHCLDFSFWSMTPDSPFMGDDWKTAALEIRSCAQQNGMEIVQAHSPAGNPLDPETEEWMLHNCIRSIQCCGAMGAPQVVIHSGARHGLSRDEFLERNRAFYRKLIPYIEETGVNVLVENIGNIDEDPYYLVTAEDLLQMLHVIGHPGFHALWDVGHANINGLDQYAQITRLNKELHGLHIHDNFCRMTATGNGWLKDAHIMPGLGTINFDAVLQGLLDVDYPGCFTFEVDAPMIYPKRPFLRDGKPVEKVSVLPLEIKMDYIRLLYKTGKFYLEQYDCFEK